MKKQDLSPLLQLIAEPASGAGADAGESKDGFRARLIKQGAEAKVYKVPSYLVPSLTLSSSEPPSTSSGTPSSALLIKHRFPKSYRHATLDTSLTRLRITHEAKSLLRCSRAGVDVPGIKAVDLDSGLLVLEWIDGYGSVREVLGGLPEEEEEVDEGLQSEEGEGDDRNEMNEIQARLEQLGLKEDSIMASIGSSIARMHQADVIHGDLTTSNMLLRSNNSIVLIDFGLSYISASIEDKAVDLYVLERALTSTHPEEEGKAEVDSYIGKILAAYKLTAGNKEWEKIWRRLKDVRMRGRKRSMVG